MKRALLSSSCLVARAAWRIDRRLAADDRTVPDARHADRNRRGEERGRIAGRHTSTASATFTAAARIPLVRLTNVTGDGVELSDISISRDGAIVVRAGHTAEPRRSSNPTANPAGASRTIWAARTTGGAAGNSVRNDAGAVA